MINETWKEFNRYYMHTAWKDLNKSKITDILKKDPELSKHEVPGNITDKMTTLAFYTEVTNDALNRICSNKLLLEYYCNSTNCSECEREELKTLFPNIEDVDELVSELRAKINKGTCKRWTNNIVTNKNHMFSHFLGERISNKALSNAPTDENGVLFLSGALCCAGELSGKNGTISHLKLIKTGFPDAIGVQHITGKKLKGGCFSHIEKDVNIEFEFAASNFKDHGHSTDKCDIIICWVNDWTNCPIEIIELQSICKFN